MATYLIDRIRYGGMRGVVAFGVAILGVVLLLVAVFVETPTCGAWEAVLLGFAAISFGIAVAIDFPGSWVIPSILVTGGVIGVLYGLTLMSTLSCHPGGI